MSQKIPMFNIEYLSSYKLFFRVGVLCFHWNSIEIKPRPMHHSERLKIWARWCYIFLCTSVKTWSIQPSNQNCNTHTLVSKSKNIMNCTGILCLFFQCVLTSWLLTTVTRDNYWPLVTIAVFDSCFHTRSMWFNSR